MMKGISNNFPKYFFSVVLGAAISAIVILLLMNLDPPPTGENNTIINTVTSTQTKTSNIASNVTKTVTETTTHTLNQTGNIDNNNIILTTKTIETTIIKTVDNTRTINLTSTIMTTRTVIITQTSTRIVEKPVELNHLYTAILKKPGFVTQLNLSSYEVEKNIEISSNAHVIATDNQNYIFVGTLGEPIQIIKIRVPEMVIEGILDTPESDGGIVHISYHNNMLYANPSGTGSIYEIDPFSMSINRIFTARDSKTLRRDRWRGGNGDHD